MPPLNIKDEKTYALARQLADQSGQSLTRVVHNALEREVQRLALSKRPAVQLQDINEIIDRIAGRPMKDVRAADDIIGYDEDGLPS
jgi:antitoxin VapB